MSILIKFNYNGITLNTSLILTIEPLDFSKSIVDMTTHLLVLILLVIVGIVINKMNTIEPTLLNNKPWYPYIIQLILPSVTAFMFVLLSYTRNQGFRASLQREANDTFVCNMQPKHTV